MHEFKPFDGPGLWFKGNLHCHSTVSDGAMPPGQVAVCTAGAAMTFLL